MTRRSMTPARKRRIHTRAGGVCYHCREPVPMFGPDVRYDHVIPIWTIQRDEDADVLPAHTACDRRKTNRDLREIAKAKRIIKKANPETRKPSRMRSRGFVPHPTLKRTFGGQVVARHQKETPA